MHLPGLRPLRRHLPVALAAFGLVSCGTELPTDVSRPRRAGAPAVAAQAIRDGAGIPSGEIVGVRPGITPGVSKRAEREASDAVSISSRADAESFARGGTGTARDPYVIEHLTIVSGVTAKPGDYGFYWVDPDADYHVLLRDVEIGGFSVAQVRVETDTDLSIAGAALFGPLGGGLRVSRGKVAVSGVDFSGLAGDGVRTIGAHDGQVTLTDCSWTETHGSWQADVVGIQSRSLNPASSIIVRHCDFTAPSLWSGARAWYDGRWTLSNCRFTCRNGFEALYDPIRGTSIQRCLFQVTVAPILANHLEGGWDIGYNEFDDSVEGVRQVRLNDCHDGRAHHNRFTKRGTADAGNECLEGFYCSDVVFDSNWVTECTEDAFEHVEPRGNCLVFDCVGDNVAGQVVDYFGNDPENGGEIHHIYGTCHDVGVILTDVDNVLVHDIHTNNVLGTYYNVRLENRHATPGVHPANCMILPPLPETSECFEGFPFGAVGPVGPGNHAEWWENGVLETWSSPPARSGSASRP